MALDPQIAQFLAAMNSQPEPNYSQLSAAALRTGSDGKRIPRNFIEDVHYVEDACIAGPGSDLPVRIYRPENAKPLPVLVFFHGGGFVIGSIDTHDNLCRALANHLPALVISVDYRLAPEHKYPAACDDAFAAVQWAAHNAGKWGGDVSQLMVGGDSAGGNLAAVACQKAFAHGSPEIAHQILLYPVCDNDLTRDSYRQVGSGYLLETEMMQWFWNQYLITPDQGMDPGACPLKSKSLSGLPPATVVTGGFDPLRDEGQAYAQRLLADGVPTQHVHVPGAIHGFLSFIGMVELSNQTLDSVATAVSAALQQR